MAVVIKLGGSLFSLPDLPARLMTLLTGLHHERCLVFPGGGVTADLVRDWQQRFRTGQDDAHWWASESLDLNARLLASVLPGSVPVTNREAVEQAWRSGQLPILAPRHVLELWEQQRPETALPHTWDVTSDSLAAWTALRWPAERLILVKSIPRPMIGQPVVAAAAQGLVDGYFSGLAGDIPAIDWCCLRDARPEPQPWLIRGQPPGGFGPDAC